MTADHDPPPPIGRTGPDRIRLRPLPRITIHAFCEDQASAEALHQAAQDRRFARAHMTVQMGGIHGATACYAKMPTPNLIVVESLQDRGPMLTDLDALAEVCDPATKVVVIGHVNDVVLYRELMRRDVSDYLIAPLGPLQILECLTGLYADPAAGSLGRVIAFIGAKSGAGSSTVCHNTAWSIAEDRGADTVIADFDLHFGTVALDFNQDPPQGMAEAVADADRFDDALLDRLLSKCSDRLSLLTAPCSLDQDYPVTPRAVSGIIEGLRRNFPYAALDVPQLWTDWVRRILAEADCLVITAEPDLTNLRNAKNLADHIKETRATDAPPHVLLNKVSMAKRPEITARDFANAIGLEPEAAIEFDPHLFGVAANNGLMIAEVSRKARAAEVYRELAAKLVDRVAAQPRDEGLLGPIFSRFGLRRTGE